MADNEAVGKSPPEAMRDRIAALAQHPVGTGKGRHVDAGLDMVVVDVAIEDDQVEGVNGRHITVTVKAFNAGERIVAWLGRLEGHDTPDPYHALRLEVSN